MTTKFKLKVDAPTSLSTGTSRRIVVPAGEYDLEPIGFGTSHRVLAFPDKPNDNPSIQIKKDGRIYDSRGVLITTMKAESMSEGLLESVRMMTSRFESVGPGIPVDARPKNKTYVKVGDGVVGSVMIGNLPKNQELAPGNYQVLHSTGGDPKHLSYLILKLRGWEVIVKYDPEKITWSKSGARNPNE